MTLPLAQLTQNFTHNRGRRDDARHLAGTQSAFLLPDSAKKRSANAGGPADGGVVEGGAVGGEAGGGLGVDEEADAAGGSDLAHHVGADLVAEHGRARRVPREGPDDGRFGTGD